MLAAFVICVAISTALFLGGFVLHRRLSASTTLGATLALSFTLLGALLSGLYVWDGPKIVEEGAGPLHEFLPKFETKLEESKKAPAKDFHVWVLGDSTHWSRGNPRVYMVTALRDLAQEKGIKDIEIEGLQWPGFNGYEYYFVLNKLLEDPPDLLILPLNLRAFGPNWNREGANTFPGLERYCRWEQIPVATGLSSPGRRITWPGILLRKLDWALFRARGEAYFNGLKIRAEEAVGVERERLGADIRMAEDLAQRAPDDQVALFELFQKYTEGTYMPQIPENHPLIGVHHAIDKLAIEHGIGVMYYTVQTPDPRAQQDWNFTTLRWALTQDPGVRFVQMTDLLTFQDFAAGEHFYFSGMQRIVQRLLDEIVLARDDAQWRATVSGGGR